MEHTSANFLAIHKTLKKIYGCDWVVLRIVINTQGCVVESWEIGHISHDVAYLHFCFGEFTMKRSQFVQKENLVCRSFSLIFFCNKRWKDILWHFLPITVSEKGFVTRHFGHLFSFLHKSGTYLRTIDAYVLDVIYLLTQNDLDSWLV